MDNSKKPTIAQFTLAQKLEKKMELKSSRMEKKSSSEMLNLNAFTLQDILNKAVAYSFIIKMVSKMSCSLVILFS
jgi:hypothetical protein